MSKAAGNNAGARNLRKFRIKGAYTVDAGQELDSRPPGGALFFYLVFFFAEEIWLIVTAEGRGRHIYICT